MANANQIKDLLQGYHDGDEKHFVQVALQIAADASCAGKNKFAQQLRNIIENIQRKQTALKTQNNLQAVHVPENLASLVVVSHPQTRLSEMVLGEGTTSALQRVMHEHHNQARLRQYGFSARRKLLLVGPPGSGKTMTASVLAGELKLPLFSVQLHGVITKYMGETAAKLHLIFEAMMKTRAVYFFDEFDAIGSDRGAKNDVGEIRRVLNSFLQFLEQDDSDSIIIAATNHESLLDSALFRRFDDVIRYGRPYGKQAIALMHNCLKTFLPEDIDLEKANDEILFSELSHAEIARACTIAAKDCILQNIDKVTIEMLVGALRERSDACRNT